MNKNDARRYKLHPSPVRPNSESMRKNWRFLDHLFSLVISASGEGETEPRKVTLKEFHDAREDEIPPPLTLDVWSELDPDFNEGEKLLKRVVEDLKVEEGWLNLNDLKRQIAIAMNTDFDDIVRLLEKKEEPILIDFFQELEEPESDLTLVFADTNFNNFMDQLGLFLHKAGICEESFHILLKATQKCSPSSHMLEYGAEENAPVFGNRFSNDVIKKVRENLTAHMPGLKGNN